MVENSSQKKRVRNAFFLMKERKVKKEQIDLQREKDGKTETHVQPNRSLQTKKKENNDILKAIEIRHIGKKMMFCSTEIDDSNSRDVKGEENVKNEKHKI
jgi:hypothetical protein